MVKEAWVRVVGLPLHLWSREVFKLIGDGCGGLINVDEETFSMANLQWARLLVRVKGRDFPSSVQLVEGSGCYSIQLWWEVQPWYSQVMPAGSGCRKGDTETEDEEGSGLGDVCRGNVLEKEAQLVEQMGIQSEPPCGSSSKGATVFSMEPAARGPGVEETYGEDRLVNRGQGAGKGVIRVQNVRKPQLFGPEEAKPIILKGWQMGCEEKPFYIKGSLVGWASLAEMGCGPAKEGLKGIRAFSLTDEVEMGARATEEDSRAGVRDDEGVACCHGGDRGLLRILQCDERWQPVDDDPGKEKSKGINMSDVVEVMQERMDLGNKWDECSLVKFSKALGFSTEGVEGEILQLLLKLKSRRDQGKKKGTLGLTRRLKMTEMSLGVVRSLGVGRFLEWGALDARGAAGGVVVFWDNRVLELMGLEVGLFSISCRFKNVEDGFRWTFSGVFPNERRRGGRVSSSMRRFSEVIDELELRDLPLQGGRLPGVESTLSRPVSDHFPILLDGGGVRRGPVPFRFENMWLQEEGFKDLLGGWWQGLRFSGSFSFILAEKLKALKVILKSWNKEVFGKVGVNKKLALDKVDFWDNQEKGRVLSMEELEARKEAREF
ncbi:hypothetical protein CK203_084032 [Vitis vinifera]|uniref:Uncharacterized protein n=1 Tax=Vitis vinifera TaxID=29760 RepID=A0A438EUU6_VITVI|nr:hypothetical protein CK203_084032 [Vitis vinifera]